MDTRKIILLVGALLVAGVTAFFARTLIMGSGTPVAPPSGRPFCSDGAAAAAVCA